MSKYPEIEKVIVELENKVAYDVAARQVGSRHPKAPKAVHAESMARINYLIDLAISKAEHENYQRFIKLTQAVKQFNILAYVRAYKEAKKQGWHKLSMPVFPDVELVSADEQIKAIEEVA